MVEFKSRSIQIVSEQTGEIAAGGRASSPIKYVSGNPSTLGNNRLVPVVTGKRIRVLAFDIHAALAVSVAFRSNAAAISGLIALGANSGKTLPYNPHGWFQTDAGQALNIDLSVAVAVGVTMVYIEV